MKILLSLLVGCTLFQSPILAQQTQSDSYTRYELLDPTSQSFRIIYDVSATTANAIYYWNTLRIGSEHKVDSVIDLYSGQPLAWTIVDGQAALKNGHKTANDKWKYLQVKLLRPVPEGGESRLRIDKTYSDKASYFTNEDKLVFHRNLGIKRNSLVLPKGYEVTACNYPVQVEKEKSGRIKLSFLNDSDGSVDFKVEARKISVKPKLELTQTSPWPDYTEKPQGRDKSKARLSYSPTERAFQGREIVYFLQQPETSSFRLYHDYTEKRVGINKYLNIVRPGSKASDPSAKILDTGEKLLVETLKGDEIKNKNIDLSGITPDTEVIVIWFDPVQKGQSVRLRIEETYTDPNRYLLYNDELVWDRSFGRNRNIVVLPEGWYLTTNTIPAKIKLNEDGLVQLDYVNPRPDNIDVYIKANRR